MEMTLEDLEEHYRIDGFIARLRECKENVAYLGLTQESLLTKVILTDKPQPIFIAMLLEKIVLHSAQEPAVAQL